ncbi:MAG: alkene reductase [Sphingomonadales bacterium]|nr:MAG: alkene reductase [Sphingomonadales bacterium]
MADASELFTPVTLGALELRNRITMSAMTRSRGGPGDTPGDLQVDYYSQRAGAGLIVTEGVQPSPAGKGYCRTPGLYSPEQVDGWRQVTRAVHARGGLIVAQIMHCGRVASFLNKDDGSEIVAPSAIRAAAQIYTDARGMVDLDAPRALETDEVPLVIEEYRQAARNARAAGFDGVELHASSGYLPMQFLSSNSNQRSDLYGGSVENRIRFAMEALDAMGTEIGYDRVGLRVCPGFSYNDIHDEDPVQTYGALFDAASTLGLAYLHLVRRTFPTVDNLALVKQRWRGNLILNNELTRDSAAEAIRAGVAEAVSFGRPFIGNPDLAERLRRDLPLANYDPNRTYTPGPEGYTDYPAIT